MAEEPKQNGENDTDAPMLRAAPYLNAVGELLGGAIFGVGGGYFVDKHFHSGPWGTLVLSVLGIGGGFYGFIRTVTRLSKEK